MLKVTGSIQILYSPNKLKTFSTFELLSNTLSKLNHHKFRWYSARNFTGEDLDGFEEPSIQTKKLYNKCFQLLGKYFTRMECTEVILNNKKCMIEAESEVKRKLDYLLKTASHTPAILSKDNALSYGYKFIIMRHEILIRAGLFRKIPYHRLSKQQSVINPKVVRDKYFTPKEIVCSTNSEFLKRCTNGTISMNELAAFEDIFYSEFSNWEKDQNDLILQDEGIDESKTDTLPLNYVKEEDTELDEPSFLNNNASFNFKPKDLCEFYY